MAEERRGLTGGQPGIALRRERGDERAPIGVADARGVVGRAAVAQGARQVMLPNEPERVPPEAHLAAGGREPARRDLPARRASAHVQQPRHVAEGLAQGRLLGAGAIPVQPEDARSRQDGGAGATKSRRDRVDGHDARVEA